MSTFAFIKKTSITDYVEHVVERFEAARVMGGGEMMQGFSTFD